MNQEISRFDMMMADEPTIREKLNIPKDEYKRNVWWKERAMNPASNIPTKQMNKEDEWLQKVEKDYREKDKLGYMKYVMTQKMYEQQQRARG